MSLAAAMLVGAMALGGCSNAARVEPASPAAGGGGSTTQASAGAVVLRFDEAAEAAELTLRWLTVADSRCPVDVVCIWGGEVVVTLEVSRSDNEMVELQLVHRADRRPEPKQALDHELRLLGVEPKPREGVTPSRRDWVATIEITPP